MRQYVVVLVEAGAVVTGDHVVRGGTRGCHARIGVDTKRADDARVQALVIEYQHRVLQPRLRVHHVSTGCAQLALVVADIGRDVTLAVQARQVKIVKGRDRATGAIHFQPGELGALDGKVDQAGMLENIPYQLAILEVVSRQLGFVFRKLATNLFRLVERIGGVLVMYQLAASQ